MLKGYMVRERLGTPGLEICLVIVGAANQSETKSHISYCVTAKSHIIHMGPYEQNPVSSSHTYFYLARFIVNITHHQYDNELNKAFVVMHVI